MGRKRTAVGQESKSWIEWSLLGLLIVGTFLLRTVGQWNRVFVDGSVWFRGADPWYHMRLVDNMMYNFPVSMRWDMHALYPHGFWVGYRPLLTWLVVGTSRLTGLDHELVGALLPPVLGALILIPIYLLGKELFGKTVGLLACFLVAVLPGELAHRSLLGFTDHHILESLLMATTVLFLVWAHKHQKLKWAVFAGASLGLYLLNWHGGIFLVFILATWFLSQFYYNYLKALPTRFLCKFIIVTFAVAAPFALPFGSFFDVLVLLLAIVAPLGVYLLSLLGKRHFLIISAFCTIGGLALLTFNLFGLGRHVLLMFSSVFWGFEAMIHEALPLTLGVAFAQYGIPILLFFGGLYFYIKEKRSLLFLVWTVILMLATFGQMRWGYYFTINVALLSSYLITVIARNMHPNVRTSAIVVLCFFLVLPSLRGTIGVATLPNNICTDWYGAMTWMRENTSEQFPEGSYYKLQGEEPYYGVLSWWDYGNWIIRIARRTPITTPLSQGASAQNAFFAATTIEEAEEALEGYNVRYVVMSRALLTAKWPAVLVKAGRQTEMKDSIAYKLWNDELEGWKQLYDGREVRIFGREQLFSSQDFETVDFWLER